MPTAPDTVNPPSANPQPPSPPEVVAAVLDLPAVSPPLEPVLRFHSPQYALPNKPTTATVTHQVTELIKQLEAGATYHVSFLVVLNKNNAQPITGTGQSGTDTIRPIIDWLPYSATAAARSILGRKNYRGLTGGIDATSVPINVEYVGSSVSGEYLFMAAYAGYFIASSNDIYAPVISLASSGSGQIDPFQIQGHIQKVANG